MDVISDVLGQLSVSREINCNYQLKGDWRVDVPAAGGACFHLLASGQATFTLDGVHHTLNAGDMILFPTGRRHIVGSDANVPPFPLEQLYQRMTWQLASDGRVCNLFELAADGPATSIICGSYGYDRSSYVHLFSHLPDHIILRNDENGVSAWLDTMIRQISDEVYSDRPGAHAALDALLHLLFVQIIRNWLTHTPEADRGWMNGLQDTQVSKAISLLHELPGSQWTVEDLAKTVGMSRSSFADRFTRLVGEPPLRYLKRWRMVRAAHMLEDDPYRSIGHIAQSIGYESEAGFSSAFKKHFGKPPGEWRRASELMPDSIAQSG